MPVGVMLRSMTSAELTDYEALFTLQEREREAASAPQPPLATPENGESVKASLQAAFGSRVKRKDRYRK